MGTPTQIRSTPQEQGLVWPSSDAHVALRPLPLGALSLNPTGFWGQRQLINGRNTIPLGAERLEDAGNLHNLRLAANMATGDYRGPVYQDSDVYKWLEAVAWELGRREDLELTKLQSEVTSLVRRAQLPDGYLNSYYQSHTNITRYSDLAHGHELYCAGHLVQAAIAQFRATGEEALLTVARKFADHLVETFGPDRRQGVPGHPEVEMALVELYRLTRHTPYLDLAKYFIEARGHGLLKDIHYGPAYYQDRVPVRAMTSLEGHAVRALYLMAGATDLAIECCDSSLLATLADVWQDTVSSKTYLTGGLGSRWEGEAFGEPFELPPDRSYCETCAAIASIMWSWRLLLATGDKRYADLIERTLFNAVLPAVSPDGTRFLYVNPLQLRSGDDYMSSRSPGKGRQPWFGTACCPTNLMRFFASLDQYAWTANSSGVQCHQYFAGKLSYETHGGQLIIDAQTDYPWDGVLQLTVAAAPTGPLELALRVPEWCKSAHISWPGQDEEASADVGYVKQRRAWQPGDSIVVNLEMYVKRVRARRDIESVYGCEALERGPLVYCFEQADLASIQLAQLRSLPGPVEVLPHPRLDGLLALSVPATVASPGTGGRIWPYGEDLPKEHTGSNMMAIATPYYAWGRSGTLPMRVWIPRAEL